MARARRFPLAALLILLCAFSTRVLAKNAMPGVDALDIRVTTTAGRTGPTIPAPFHPSAHNQKVVVTHQSGLTLQTPISPQV
jgi:hypothetical protein